MFIDKLFMIAITRVIFYSLRNCFQALLVKLIEYNHKPSMIKTINISFAGISNGWLASCSDEFWASKGVQFRFVGVSTNEASEICNSKLS